MRPQFRVVGALGIAALLVTADLSAQQYPIPPGPGRREIPNLDFRPNGGWRVKAARVAKAREAALARGDLQLVNGPGMAMAVEGALKIPVVFISYADTVADSTTAVIGDTSAFHDVFFSASPAGRPYSLKTYYEQLSNGHLTLDGKFYGWVKTPLTYAAVGSGCAGVFFPTFCTSTQVHNGLGAMFRAALDSLNSAHIQVDWGQFDNDGPDGVPNSGDDDGYVDFIAFIHPSLGGECGGTGGGQQGNRIWAHRWVMTGVSGSSYVTKTAKFGGGFIRIEDYTVQSARGGNGSCTASAIMPIGTLAHETGHTFNIPDLYCTSAGCPSEGVGEWSLMASGNYTRAYSPAAWDAWSLLTVGWVAVDTLKTSGTITLNPVQTRDTVTVVPVTGSSEYFLLENRAFLQSDTAQMAAGYSRRKTPGLLIWHIDTAVVNAGLPGNSVNNGNPEGVHLVQADGHEDLHAGNNRGDSADSYPGFANVRALTYHTTPASLRNDGTVTGFVFDSIYQSSPTGPITFRFRRSAPYRVTSTGLAAGAQVTVNGVAGTAFEDLFGIGDSITMSVADSQFTNAGRSRFDFASWSDAGARVHTVVSDGTPDTVTANLTAKHRVNFTTNGTGSITTNGPATNSFIVAGTKDTLTAVPGGGATFTNWTGDTTTANAVLILPMGRPYNVVANFSGAVTVTFQQATNQILGLGGLTSPQITYLDSQGNNNATFDLGDYLAYLKANGYVTAPALPTSTAAPAPRHKER